MSLRLALARRRPPAALRRLLLDELAAVTAEGFGCPPPRWSGRAVETRLIDYARFTADQTEIVLAANDSVALASTTDTLRLLATGLGARARRWLGVRTASDALEALALLYRAIGIDARVEHGALRVRTCVFADHYTERACRVMAAMDEGIFAGLSAGGRLGFDKRMTASAAWCSAHLDVGVVR
jgi:hypothetical protein